MMGAMMGATFPIGWVPRSPLHHCRPGTSHRLSGCYESIGIGARADVFGIVVNPLPSTQAAKRRQVDPEIENVVNVGPGDFPNLATDGCRSVPFKGKRKWLQRFAAWQDIALTVCLLAVSIHCAWKRGSSLIGVFSFESDRAFVATMMDVG